MRVVLAKESGQVSLTLPCGHPRSSWGFIPFYRWDIRGPERAWVCLTKITQPAETMTSILPQCLLGRQAESLLLRTLAWA